MTDNHNLLLSDQSREPITTEPSCILERRNQSSNPLLRSEMYKRDGRVGYGQVIYRAVYHILEIEDVLSIVDLLVVRLGRRERRVLSVRVEARFQGWNCKVEMYLE